MRIAVMGAGGLGGFYGGKLLKQGNDVSFIARGAHLKAIKANGLKLLGPDEETTLKSVFITENPADIGSVDVILFAVKLYDVEAAAKLIKPIVSQNTLVISVLNGINGPGRILSILNKGLVYAGSARVSARISEPGIVTYLGQRESHKLTFGHFDSLRSKKADDFCISCNKAGFPSEILDNIEIELWDKLMQLTCVAGLTTLARKPMGTVLNDPDLSAIGELILREVEAIARAKGILLPQNIFEKKVNLIYSFPAELFASMYYDLVLGKKMEVEDIFGYLVREGKKNSIKTPIINFLYGFLKPHMFGA